MLNQYTDYIVILTKLHLTTLSFSRPQAKSPEGKTWWRALSPEGGSHRNPTKGRGGGEERKGGASNDGQTFN